MTVSDEQKLWAGYSQLESLVDAAKAAHIQAAKNRDPDALNNTRLALDGYDALAKRAYDDAFVFTYGTLRPATFHEARVRALANLMQFNGELARLERVPYHPLGQEAVNWALRCATWTWWKDAHGFVHVAARTPMFH